MENTRNNETKKGGNLSHAAIYGKISAWSEEILNTLHDLLDDPNRNLRFAAAKTLLNKLIPDKKAVEVTGKDGQPFTINIITGKGFLPPDSRSFSSSAGSIISGQPQVQDDSMAQKSEKNDNSNNGTGQTVTP